MSKKYKLLIVCILSYIKSDLTFIMRKSGKKSTKITLRCSFKRYLKPLLAVGQT